MANPKHLIFFFKGNKTWNKWRDENPSIIPDLRKANLENMNLGSWINLNYANLQESILSNSRSGRAQLFKADLSNANLRGASLTKANCKKAIFYNTDLSNTNLEYSRFDGADLRKANLTNSYFNVNSCNNVKLDDAILQNMNIPDDDPIDWMYSSASATSMFNLAWADGLENVNKHSQTYVLGYIERLFQLIHDERYLKDYYKPQFISETLEKIKVLSSLLNSDENPPKVLLDAIKSVNIELINYLKHHPEYLHKIDWRVFEELIAEILSSFGWSIELTQPTKDNGYDIFGIYQDISGLKHSWIIECKKWDIERPVGVDIIRSLYGVKTDLRVGSALLATTSHFTKGAVAFKASKYDLELRDYNEIINWINYYKPNSNGRLFIKDNRICLK